MADLNNLSLAQLRDLEIQVAEQIKQRQSDEVAKVQQQIVALAKSVGMTVEQIMRNSKAQTKKPVAALYRHPGNPELQWTGRGRKPRWITEYLGSDSTKSIDSLRI